MKQDRLLKKREWVCAIIAWILHIFILYYEKITSICLKLGYYQFEDRTSIEMFIVSLIIPILIYVIIPFKVIRKIQKRGENLFYIFLIIIFLLGAVEYGMDALRPEINWNGYLYSSIETDISTMYCVSLWIIMCWCMVLEFGAKSYVIGFMIYIFSIEKAKTMIIKKSGALICILNIKPFNRMSVILFMTMMLFATNSSAYKKVIRNTNHFLKDKKYIEVKKSDKS